MRFNQFARTAAIAIVLMTSGVACQPTEAPAPDNETTAPSTETPAPAETAEQPATSAETPSTSAPAEAPSEAPERAPETAVTPQPTAQAEKSCSVSAFVADTDPAGLNVRSGPGSDYPVLDTLPTNEPVEVSIVGVNNGWFLINEAYSQAQQELEQPGWVYAPLLGVTTTSLNINNPEAPAPLYEAPDGFSNVKAEVPKYTEVSLLSCSGDWLQVQTDGTTGWLAIGDQCSNPTSTCP